MNHKFISIIGAAALAIGFAPHSDACTGMELKTKNGEVVMARTIEWSGSDMNTFYVVVPKAYTPDTKYAFTGVAVELPQYIMEGVNEKGLSAGLFYFPDYGKYEEEANGKTSVSDFELVGYILSRCATIDEVKSTIAGLHIHGIDPRSSTVHWRFIEESGRQVVLEIIDGKQVFYENTVGVLTNSPSFDYHLTNLNNYVNLMPGRAGANTIGRLEMTSFSGGTGMLGLPGDFSSPSRFVRVAFLQNTAPVRETALETVTQAFHLLNNFDIPIGMQFAKGEEVVDIPSATHVTVASDLSGHKLYFRTLHNCEIRCIDLNRINFKKTGYVCKPLDKVKAETIHQIF